jgi:aminotransferase
LNPRALATAPSPIRRIADLAAVRAANGSPVFPFHLGEPDFDTPPAIKRAAIDAMMAGHVHYTPNAGIAPLRTAIAADLRRRYGATLDPADVIVTVGACEALTLAFMATLEPGAEVVVPTPCWPNYLQTPLLLGSRVREVAMDAGQGFRLNAEAVLAAIGPDTRAIVINTPNNPSGADAAADAIRTLLDGARHRGVWLIADEIYHDLTFEPGWTSVLEIARPDDPLIYVNGFSKSYAMTGWRLGYAVARGDVANAMTRLHQALVTSATSFVQHAAIAALAERDEVVTMRNRYEARLERVLDVLRSAGIECPVPAGGFYVFPQVPPRWPDGDAFSEEMLGEHGVALVPGSAFGAAHRDRFRLCFACADDVLDAGLQVLGRAVGSGYDG